MIRLMIIADQPAVRKGLTMRISAEPDLVVIGEASCGEEASAMAQALRPDIVIVDADMADMRGVLTASQIHKMVPKSAIMILSIHDDTISCEQAEEAGAVAFVSKLMPADSLLQAIRHVGGGAS